MNKLSASPNHIGKRIQYTEPWLDAVCPQMPTTPNYAALDCMEGSEKETRPGEGTCYLTEGKPTIHAKGHHRLPRRPRIGKAWH